MAPQNDVEQEIRRQMLAEQAARQARPAVPMPPSTIDPPPYYAAPKKKSSAGGLAGAGAALLALLAKFKFLLLGLKFLAFGKIFLTFGSMLVSAWVYSLRFGWAFGAGLVMLLLLHESGHAFALRLRRRPVNGMVFIPFFGAYVKHGVGTDIVEDAFVSLMGPLFGALTSVACVGIYWATRSPFWLELAQWGCFINLINLAPTVPLDGGRIVSLFSPKLMALGLVCLVFLIPLNPLIGLLALLGLPHVISVWRADPRTQDYYHATLTDRLNFGIAYLGLALFLALGQYSLNVYLQRGILPHF